MDRELALCEPQSSTPNPSEVPYCMVFRKKMLEAGRSQGSSVPEEAVWVAIRRAAGWVIPTRWVSEGRFSRSLTDVSGYDWWF
jgi:hypothetical protein